MSYIGRDLCKYASGATCWGLGPVAGNQVSTDVRWVQAPPVIATTLFRLHACRRASVDMAPDVASLWFESYHRDNGVARLPNWAAFALDVNITPLLARTLIMHSVVSLRTTIAVCLFAVSMECPSPLYAQSGLAPAAPATLGFKNVLVAKSRKIPTSAPLASLSLLPFMV